MFGLLVWQRWRRVAVHKDIPLKKHYYVIQGYRPIALWENTVVVENLFPLSEYEKETLLDSVVQVC